MPDSELLTFHLNKSFVYLIFPLNAFRVCQVGQLKAQFLIVSGILLQDLSFCAGSWPRGQPRAVAGT